MSAPFEPVHTQYAPSVLNVEPYALPAMREAFEHAVELLNPHLETLRHDGMIEQDWIGDEGSRSLRAFYNDRIMTAPDGPYGALVKYRDLLRDIRDQLAASEAEYRRVEGENSELWGRA